MTKTLLIIGAGYQQIKAYQVAKEMGLHVVGTDMDKQAPAFQYADDQLICSTRNSEETLKIVMEYQKKQRIDGVMTIANDVPYTVSVIADALNLPAIDLEAAKNVSNKLNMKRLWEKDNISIPAYKIVRSFEELQEGVRQMNLPLVLKPSDGRGSKGVLFLDEDIDLKWAWEESLENSENQQLLLEKYEKGAQMSVESVFINNQFFPIAFADRNYDRLQEYKPYIIEDGGVIPSQYDDKVLSKVSQLVEFSARSLGLNWGSVKADIVISPDGPKIIELAGRLSGGFLATHHIPRAYGVNIVKIVMKLSLGENVSFSEVQVNKKEYIGVRYFFSKPGRIKNISIPELNKTDEIDLYLEKGDMFPEVINSGCTAGYIMTFSNSYRNADERAKKISQEVVINTE